MTVMKCIFATSLVSCASAFLVPPPHASLALRGGGATAIARASSSSLSALSMGDPKLIYFDARGVVEPSRLLLAAAGVNYEDKRYIVDMSAKPPSAPEFNTDKEAGALAVNMGRAPILEIDGAQIGQSHAIARFLARKYSMMGANDIEAAQIDTLYEHVRDIKDAWLKVRINPSLDEEAKKVATEKHLSTDLPEWCKKLETSMALFKGANGCAVGQQMSLADVSIYAWLSMYYPTDKKTEVESAYAACPNIVAIMSAVGANSGIQSWEAKRPVTMM